MTKEKGARITIDELAAMMNSSFEALKKDLKEEIGESNNSLKKELKAEIQEVKDRLDTVEDSLERIENKVENRHETRITKLEDDMRVVKTTIGK